VGLGQRVQEFQLRQGGDHLGDRVDGRRVVRVRTAYVSTLGADAVDAFYLTDEAGRPLAAQRAGEVAAAVRAALG
ncbi:hypothetical protein ACWC5I_43865, partial [Kitasatospora sp. NPDC001574]